MAYLHPDGFSPPSERQLKSLTTIDEEMLAHFKSVVARKARFYERYYVAEIGKR
jgi:hypothetical protein